MRVATVIIAAAAFASAAGSAFAAADRATDVEFLKANRCKGLAASAIGQGVDTAGVDAFLKAQSGARNPYILQQGEAEQTKARRQAARGERNDKLAAELNGPCMAYLGQGAAQTAQGGSVSAH